MRSILAILGLVVISEWSTARSADNFGTVYGNGLFEFAMFCGKAQWQNDAARLEGKSWSELVSFAQQERKRGEEEVKKAIEACNGDSQKLAAEKKRFLQKLRDLAPKASACQKENRVTYSKDEVLFTKAILKAPQAVVSTEEGVEEFVRDLLLPKIVATGMKVLVIGEHHLDQHQRFFQSQVLKQLAAHGIKVAWVAHEWLKIDIDGDTDETSHSFLNDFSKLSNKKFREVLPGYFKYDEPRYLNRTNELGLREFFGTLHALYRAHVGLFQLHPLERRYESVWDVITGEDISHEPTFENSVLKKYVQELKNDEIGVIITGASHASLDPEDIRDIESFKKEVTDRVLTVVQVRYYGMGYTHALHCYDGYMQEYLADINMAHLVTSINIYPIQEFLSLKDLKRLMGKLTYNYGNTYAEPQAEMPSLFEILKSTILKSPLPHRSSHHPTVVDIAAGRDQEGIDRKTHPAWFADFFYLY